MAPEKTGSQNTLGGIAGPKRASRGTSFWRIVKERRLRTSSTTPTNPSTLRWHSSAIRTAKGGWRKRNCTTTGPLWRGWCGNLKRNPPLTGFWRARMSAETLASGRPSACWWGSSWSVEAGKRPAERGRLACEHRVPPGPPPTTRGIGILVQSLGAVRNQRRHAVPIRTRAMPRARILGANRITPAARWGGQQACTQRRPEVEWSQGADHWQEAAADFSRA